MGGRGAKGATGTGSKASSANYEVRDLRTNESYFLANGTKIQNVEVFAGKGTKTVFRKAADYAKRYGGKAKDWQHAKGHAVLKTPDGDRTAEIHWVQCKGIGKHAFFVKRWED